MSEENNAGGTRRKLEDEVETVSLAEIVQETEEWNDTAAAVLGGSDEENCSYDQGYVKRQALYSCLTCNPVTAEPYTAGGICLACSLKCHLGHELVELYTKRNFRCDCGNKKFSTSSCLLQPVKSDYNAENKYNHNFKGLYCICERPYPDPEEEEDDDDDEDEMIQCVVCEDWFHGRHTENDYVDLANPLVDTSDFICKSCTQKCHFLSYYDVVMLKDERKPSQNLTTSTATKDGGVEIFSDDTLAVTSDLNLKLSSPAVATMSENMTGSNHRSFEVSEPEVLKATASGASTRADIGGKESGDVEESSQDSGIDSNSGVDVSESSILTTIIEKCMLKKNAPDSEILASGTWWIRGWRTTLCDCETCMGIYDSLGVNFLKDPEDTLEVYEAKGKSKDTEKQNFGERQLMRALGSLDHVGRIEVIHGYNELKDGLVELIQRVNTAGRAVTTEDVETFFTELKEKANKRRRVNDVYVPDNCR